MYHTYGWLLVMSIMFGLSFVSIATSSGVISAGSEFLRSDRILYRLVLKLNGVLFRLQCGQLSTILTGLSEFKDVC